MPYPLLAILADFRRLNCLNEQLAPFQGILATPLRGTAKVRQLLVQLAQVTDRYHTRSDSGEYGVAVEAAEQPCMSIAPSFPHPGPSMHGRYFTAEPL